MDERTRQELGDYLSRWRTAEPALAEHRATELAVLSDDAARAPTLDLFRWWQPPVVDDEGAELVAQQRMFTFWRLRQGAAP